MRTWNWMSYIVNVIYCERHIRFKSGTYPGARAWSFGMMTGNDDLLNTSSVTSLLNHGLVECRHDQVWSHSAYWCLGIQLVPGHHHAVWNPMTRVQKTKTLWNTNAVESHDGCWCPGIYATPGHQHPAWKSSTAVYYPNIAVPWVLLITHGRYNLAEYLHSEVSCRLLMSKQFISAGSSAADIMTNSTSYMDMCMCAHVCVDVCICTCVCKCMYVCVPAGPRARVTCWL